MQLGRLALIFVAVPFFLYGCGVKTEVPIQAEDIRFCSDVDTTVRTIRTMAEEKQLSFHYGTHTADYGKQTTFRLIGRDFELELFNSISKGNYTLRVYKTDGGDPRVAVKAFAQFRDEVRLRLGVAACNDARSELQ